MKQTLVSQMLKDKMPEFTVAEKKVARTLIADYPTLGMQPIAKLSVKAKVSGPTVVRLIAKLGFSGYPEFQERLLSEIKFRHTSALEQYENLPKRLTKQKLLRHCLTSFTNALENTFVELPVSEFNRALGLLSDTSRPVTCIGGRFSEIIARYMAVHLHALRAKSRYLADLAKWRSAELIDIGKKDVILVFDFRRYERDTYEFSEMAAKAGASIILITDPYMSPIADCATCVLPVEISGPSPFDTYLPAIGLIETLLAGLVSSLGAKGQVRIKKLEGILSAFEMDDPASGD